MTGANTACNIALVGGGHAHVHVLAAMAGRSRRDVSVTLISRGDLTAYSGMLPGVVAGLYAPAQANIDLVKLASATGAHFIRGEAVGIDRVGKRVLLSDSRRIAYDLLSIDVGISPSLTQIDGADRHGIAIKPIGLFLEKLDRLIEEVRSIDGPRRIAMIGGGAGGVELTLSLHRRLRGEMQERGISPESLKISLISAETILSSHNARVSDAFRRIFRERNIRLVEGRRAVRISDSAIQLDDGSHVHSDRTLVATNAGAPGWLSETGLSLDAGGFVAVGPTLQSLNDPEIFAAGDCASLTHAPREKAGVYAVRAGPPLAENLYRRAKGEHLKEWHPQERHLSLISTGERYAVASRGFFKAEGRWVWWIKDWIDRRWMRQYQSRCG